MDRVVIDRMDGALAGSAPLPRDNGELVFEEPWQGRALGIGVATVQQHGIGYDEFREALIEAIARHPEDPSETAATAYYASWLDAVETVLSARELLP